MDASYAIHDDFKGHTGAVINLVKGAVASLSRNQKYKVRVPLETSSLEKMMHPHKHFGPNTFWGTKGILLSRKLCTIKTRVPFCWSQMEKYPIPSVPIISR